MSLPEFLPKETVENALRKYLNMKNLCIVGLTSKHAVPVGDNYCSDMYRLTVKYSATKNGNIETISLIAKCKPQTGIGQSFTTEIPVFEKEIEMYSTILPNLYNLLKGKKYSADCLDSAVGRDGWLLLQDLAPFGYKMANRRVGLDKEHCLIVLEGIAKMHASSAMLYEKDPHSMDKFNTGMYTNLDNPTVKQFCVSGYQSLINAVKKWPGFEKYSDKLASFSNNIYQKNLQVSKRKPGFNVLNHGDLWVNNMLFRYNSDGKPDDVKFVDYQFSVFVSPSIDLQYFFHSSVTDDVGKTELPNLIKFYYEELTKNLKKMNYPKEKMPSFEDICSDYKDRALYGLTTAVVILPIARAPSREDANLEELFKSNDGEESFRETSYNETCFKNRMHFLLPHFEQIGLLC